MNVLYIGGTGVISTACARHAVRRGHSVTLMTRGRSERPVPEGCEHLRADARDTGQLRDLLAGRRFDVAVNWIGYLAEQVERDIVLFSGRVHQYVFISSATVYRRPPRELPLRESSALGNGGWQYAADKLACEEVLRVARRERGFPVTIVRPSTTYDPSFSPLFGGYTTIARLRLGKPVVVAGDGRTSWVLTHHEDFAAGFVGLLGDPRAIGEAVHLTSDEVLTWNQIHGLLAAAAGGEVHPVHLPPLTIAEHHADWGARLLGDKAHSMVFDNGKLRTIVPDFKAVVPFARGAQEIIAWYDADPARRRIDRELDGLMDRLAQIGRL